MLKRIPQLTQYQVFVCGPKAFRQTTQGILRELSLARQNYHYESFGDKVIKQELKKNTRPKTKPANSLDLYFSHWQLHHQGNCQQTLLEQGEAAGLKLPNSCRAGMCGSCKAKLTHGEVKQMAMGPLTAIEKQQGFILLCSCLPMTNVVIEHDNID